MKTNKYTYYYVIQGNYGYGWDDLFCYDKSAKDARKNAKATYLDYFKNDNGVFRIINRRELNK